MSEGNLWIMWNLCLSLLKLQNKDLPTSQKNGKICWEKSGRWQDRLKHFLYQRTSQIPS